VGSVDCALTRVKSTVEPREFAVLLGPLLPCALVGVFALVIVSVAWHKSRRTQKLGTFGRQEEEIGDSFKEHEMVPL